ncbi:uncharacterized protein LOC118409430 [Branchiostoma floridae]|uniref:Uncharacterized protein LOC118409430 n=1 Tax=Branchiostoma floridae TaxID=7739 RepID=A0A9J7HV94_BRAFL|nr:uncharacterized protein LOC118409430 [Branchiostoma floridae]
MDTVVGLGRDPARPLTRGRSCMRQGIFVWNHDLLKINTEDETGFSIRGQPLTLHQPKKQEDNSVEVFNHLDQQKPKNLSNLSIVEPNSEQSNPNITLEPIETQNAKTEDLDVRIEFLTSVISKFRLQKRKGCLHQFDWTADQGQGQPRCSRCGKLMRTAPRLPEVRDKLTKQRKDRVNIDETSIPNRLKGKLLFIRDDGIPPKTGKGNKRRKAKKVKQTKNTFPVTPTGESVPKTPSMIIQEVEETNEDIYKEERPTGPRRVLVRFSSKRTVRTFVPDAPVSGAVRIVTRDAS